MGGDVVVQHTVCVALEREVVGEHLCLASHCFAGPCWPCCKAAGQLRHKGMCNLKHCGRKAAHEQYIHLSIH